MKILGYLLNILSPPTLGQIKLFMVPKNKKYVLLCFSNETAWRVDFRIENKIGNFQKVIDETQQFLDNFLKTAHIFIWIYQSFQLGCWLWNLLIEHKSRNENFKFFFALAFFFFFKRTKLHNIQKSKIKIKFFGFLFLFFVFFCIFTQLTNKSPLFIIWNIFSSFPFFYFVEIFLEEPKQFLKVHVQPSAVTF